MYHRCQWVMDGWKAIQALRRLKYEEGAILGGDLHRGIHVRDAELLRHVQKPERWYIRLLDGGSLGMRSWQW